MQRIQFGEPDYDAMADEFEPDEGQPECYEEPEEMTEEEVIAKIKACKEKLLDGNYDELEELVDAYYSYDKIAGQNGLDLRGYPEYRIDDLKSILVYAAIAYDSVAAELMEFYKHVIKEVDNET